MTDLAQCRIAASPINWCNDDMVDLGDRYSFQDILRDMSSLGFTGTEMGRKYPRRARDLRPALAQWGLVLSSAWKTVHLTQSADALADVLSQYQDHVRFLRDMGCEYVVTAEGGGSVHWDVAGDAGRVSPFTAGQWEIFARNLNVAGRMCKNHGLKLAYHAHYGTNVETEEDIDRLMAMTDPEHVTLLYDTGHIALGGGDPLGVLKRHLNRIEYVHLKDVRESVATRVAAKELGFLEAVRAGVFTVPGDGAIDFSPLFEVLADSGYRGWFVIEAEQDPDRAQPIEYMKRALDYLRPWLPTARRGSGS